jgi:two-component system response regulator AtoC
MAKVLIADDEEGVRTFLGEALEDEHEVVLARDGQEAMDALKREAFHVLITDLRMPRLRGDELIQRARAENPELEIIVLTAHGTVDSAVAAMKAGAFDYLQKPLASPTELRLLVARALEHRGLKNLREQVLTDGSDTLTWGDPAMAPIVNALHKVSKTDATVLLLGESGTGKEVMARALHRESKRRDRPFVAINCAALTDTLLESELFGHEKGAFTGAVSRKRGKLELAEGGTFFLDEVGELKPELQAKLLRVLELKQFERVGGGQTLSADVRWVAATHRDLPSEITAGRFREDLYHRLAVFPLKVPPLRERRTDLLPLAEALLVRVGASMARSLRLDDSAKAAILAYGWPGNARELKNALERAIILADSDTLTASDLMLPTPQPSPEGTLAATEKAAILEALASVGGHRKKAAERLGIAERTLYDKLKAYGIK